MRQRRMTAAACLVLLIAAAGCAANTQSAPEEELITSAQSPEGDIIDLPEAGKASIEAPSPGPLAQREEQVIPPDIPPPVSATPGALPTQTPVATPAYGMSTVKRQKGYVKGHDVNLRKGPGTEHGVVGQISYQTELVITEKNDLWYRIECDTGAEGYMLKEFVGVGAIPTPTPTPKPTKKPTATPKVTPKATEKTTPKATAKPTPTPVIKSGGEGRYSDEEIYLVAKLIYAEGKKQSQESFLAMASVLYNRCHSKRFGGTVQQEVYRKNQFTVVKYDSFEGLTPSSAALAAAKEVFLNGNRTIPEGVMYFRSGSKSKSWSSRTYYATIGGNHYYY